MKMNLMLLVFFASLCGTSLAFATGQEPDKLKYEGKNYDLFSNPLESFYAKDKSKRPKFMSVPNGVGSGNWCGYVAHWEIAGDKLYRAGIDSWFCDDSIQTENHCRKATLADIVAEKIDEGRIYASWFSGELRVPGGKELMYVHMGYGSVYERDIMFAVDKGNVGKPRVQDNKKQPLPSAKN